MLCSDEILKLLKESSTGDCNAVIRLRNQNPDLQWTDLKYEKTGDTILHIAARNGCLDLLKYIVESSKFESTNCKNKDDKTPLHEAAQFGQYEIVKFLLEHKANVNALKRADWTPLMLSCTKVNENTLDRYKIVELLLKNGAVVNYRNKDGWTAFHLICREGDLAILELLLCHNADFNARTKNLRTGLHIACLHGHLDIVKRLCSLNIDVNARDSCGNTPLHEAILGDGIDIAKELINNGAEITLRNNADFSLLHLAASQSSTSTIDYVLNELKFDINESTDKGFTALHCAARKGRKLMFEYLVSKGADVELVDSFGRKAVDYLELEST